MAMRDIKRYTAKEESDDEDDDLEIVSPPLVYSALCRASPMNQAHSDR